MTEVRCCCTPENLIGHVPLEAGLAAGLVLRELDDGREAFESRDDVIAVPGFVKAMSGGTRKTWRKRTWRKK